MNLADIVKLMKDERLYTITLSFMSRIAAGDTTVIEQICSKNANVIYKEGQLTFMISGLYRHIVIENNELHNDPTSLISYEEFRHLLYNTDLNTQLAKKGYTIAVCPSDDTSGKVDTNWYELKPLLN
jgi:hypothetical protein